MALYSVTTTAEQEVLLSILSKQSNQQAAQIVSDILTQSLSNIESQQADSFIATLKTEDGLQTLSDLATAAEQNPNPNSKTA